MAAADMVEPYVQYTYQLLDQIEKGYVRIPMFQRPLVWGWDKQQELLRSIRDGIPMGAVMLWETRGAWIRSRDDLHGHPLGPPPPGNQIYLLDGLQRLSTLFAALRGPGSYVQDQAPDTICYDLIEQDFVRKEDAEVNAVLLPLRVLLSSVELLRFQRHELRDDALVLRADELARAFREYKVPVIPIEGDDLDLATRTFKLLNSQGTPMEETDMVHALTWSETFALRDRLEDEIARELQPLGWGDISADTVLRVVKANLDIGLYEKDTAETLARGLHANPGRLDRAVRGIARVAKFLRRHCGVYSPNLVPYDLQTVLLTDALSRVKRGVGAEEALASWFFLTMHAELFAGLSGYRVQRALDDIRTTARDGKLRWSGPREPVLRLLPRRRFDFKSARAKGLALILGRRRSDADGKNWAQLLARHGSQALVPLLPRDVVGADFLSAGNRFLCLPAEARLLRQKLLDRDPITGSERWAHLITEDALAAARQGRWNEFVTARFYDMMSLEEDLLADLRSQIAE